MCVCTCVWKVCVCTCVCTHTGPQLLQINGMVVLGGMRRFNSSYWCVCACVCAPDLHVVYWYEWFAVLQRQLLGMVQSHQEQGREARSGHHSNRIHIRHAQHCHCQCPLHHACNMYLYYHSAAKPNRKCSFEFWFWCLCLSPSDPIPSGLKSSLKCQQ